VASFATLEVAEVLSERKGFQRLRLVDGSRAYNLTDLTGSVASGDSVVVNTTAVERGLGTGGWHVVHWNLSQTELRTPTGGHIMKMRYTSLQSDTGSFEENLETSGNDSLNGTPVIVCSLHSQMAAAAVAFHHVAPNKRLVYVMTDGAALPIAMSDLVADLSDRGVLAATVTSGHAFGGDSEAVNVPSALLAAHHVHQADAVIVAMGPGVVGTGTKLGTTSLETVDIATWAYRLSGLPIFALRGSSADERPRHQGISHHSRTALSFLRAASIDIVVPVALEDAAIARGLGTLATTKLDGINDVFTSEHALRIATMGRDVRADPLFFRLSAAAGVAAALRLEGL
jgi:Protein of unknown function (DUF3866)